MFQSPHNTIYNSIIYTFLLRKESFWINIYTEWTTACCEKKFGGIIFVRKNVCWITALSLGTEILIGLITFYYGFNILYICMYDKE
jgi:hypothetical protein